MSNVIDIGGKQNGYLWTRKISPRPLDGLVLTVRNSKLGKASTTTQHVFFRQSAFDLHGERIALADHHGNVFILDLSKNRFTLAFSTGVPLTAMEWNKYRLNEILVALSNNELRCYNIGKKELVCIMKGHSSIIDSISIHGSGKYILTSSFDTTILWDLNTFLKKRTLTGAQEVGIQNVFFLPNSNHIVSCFKDDSIFVWDCESMKCVYQLSIPVGKKPGYKCLASTNDCRVLVAGGRSRFLHIWNLDSRQLIQVIELPEKVKIVKRIDFVTNKMALNQHQLLAVLSQDGILRFIDTNNCILKAEIGDQQQRIHSFLLSKNSQYLVAIMDNGDACIHHFPTVLKTEVAKYSITKVVSEGSNKRKEHLPKKCKNNKALETTVKSTNNDTTSATIHEDHKGPNVKRLKAVLKGFGEYPAKYRLFIWKSLLRLPENHSAFSALVDKGTHIAYATLHEKYPIKSRKLLRVLQRVSSALGYWSPIFGEAEFLPMLIFPIVKLFPNNQLICFEMTVTIIVNWCQKWFEYFPNPPLTILAMVETLLSHHDAVLLQHFIELDISTQLYAWPMMQTLFSEVVTKDEWLVVWDNIFSNHPSFMLYFIVAYLIQSRQALLSAKSKDDIKFFFHHHNAVNISEVIKETYRYSSSTPPDIDPKGMLNEFTSIPQGQYPIFDFYPKFVVDYLIEERERIREEELEYLHEKQLALDMKKHRDLKMREEMAFYREQGEIAKAEQERRDIIANEEKKLVQQRKKLQSLRRDIAMQELDVHDEVRRKFLQHQGEMKRMQLQRLDDEMKRKLCQRDEEMKEALTDAEIKAMEIETQKRQLQQELMREELDSSFRLESERELLRKQEEKNSRKLKKVIEKTYKLDGERLKEYHAERGKLGHQRQNICVQTDLAARNRLWGMEREIQAIQIAKINHENTMKENELHKMLDHTINEQRPPMEKEKEVGVSKNAKLSTPQPLENDNSDDESEDSEYDDDDEDDTGRGSFNNHQLDLMSQIRDLRTNLARKKQLSFVHD